MGTAIATVGKQLLKIFLINIFKNSNEDKNIITTIFTVFGIILALVITLYSFVCFTPLSILSPLFGIDFETIKEIKISAGYFQEQDIAYLKNQQKEYYYIDADGNDSYYYTDEFSDVYIPNGSNCVYFNQADERWANHPYSGSTSTWTACGPTSMAMVISTLTGKNISPPTIMDIAEKSGYACVGAGSYHSIVPGLSKQFGLKCTGIGNDKKKLKKALEQGNLVVAIMGRGDFTRNGHFIVLRGITSDGKVLVNDLASNRRTNTSWDFYKFPEQSNKWSGAGGPFWVISK